MIPYRHSPIKIIQSMLWHCSRLVIISNPRMVPAFKQDGYYPIYDARNVSSPSLPGSTHALWGSVRRQDKTGQDTLAANPANPAMRPERGGASSSRTPQSAARLAAVSAAPIPSHGCVNYQKKLVLYGYLLSVDDLSSKATRGKESEIFLLSHMQLS